MHSLATPQIKHTQPGDYACIPTIGTGNGPTRGANRKLKKRNGHPEVPQNHIYGIANSSDSEDLLSQENKLDMDLVDTINKANHVHSQLQKEASKCACCKLFLWIMVIISLLTIGVMYYLYLEEIPPFDPNHENFRIEFMSEAPFVRFNLSMDGLTRIWFPTEDQTGNEAMVNSTVSSSILASAEILATTSTVLTTSIGGSLAATATILTNYIAKNEDTPSKKIPQIGDSRMQFPVKNENNFCDTVLYPSQDQHLFPITFSPSWKLSINLNIENVKSPKSILKIDTETETGAKFQKKTRNIFKITQVPLGALKLSLASCSGKHSKNLPILTLKPKNFEKYLRNGTETSLNQFTLTVLQESQEFSVFVNDQKIDNWSIKQQKTINQFKKQICSTKLSHTALVVDNLNSVNFLNYQELVTDAIFNISKDQKAINSCLVFGTKFSLNEPDSS